MQNIALAFSGGGFRAACFSLGTLAYLDKIQYKESGLLQQVRFISSTSGGSITNLVYSSFVFNGKKFKDVYIFLDAELDGEKLLANALKILRKSEEWQTRPQKSRNLINAFSIAYDQLLNRAELGIFSKEHNSHLQEICINSTEFTNGLPFRFQSQPRIPGFPKGKVGNRFIYFTLTGQAAAARLKLSDILACSSCFPSGFEPMIFPDDFSHQTLDVGALRQGISYTSNSFTVKEKASDSDDENEDGDDDDEGLFIDPLTGETVHYNSLDLLPNEAYNKNLRFGIMDGGVADNQAIDAFKRANERRENNSFPAFDLLIACDVTSHYMDGYTLPMEKKSLFKNVTLKMLLIFWILWMLVLPALLIFAKVWTGWMYVTGTLSAILLLPVLFFLLKWIKNKFIKKTAAGTFGNMLRKYAGTFFSLRLGVLQQMISSRFKSVFILANDIYLKQIRRMYYDDMFNNERYKKKIIQNVIYDLSRVKFDPADISTSPFHPSGKMIAVAEKARTMGTTLWFDKVHQRENVKDAIIATGQFTTCYNLLLFLENAEEGTITHELNTMKTNLLTDWEKFNEDPFWLVNELNSKTNK